MEELVAKVAEFIRRRRSSLGRTYIWKIPRVVPCPFFHRGTDPLWQANRRLRKCLSQQWKMRTTTNRRLALAKWYVAVWGGVRRNKDETLRSYVAAKPATLVDGDLSGVSTWSKILAVQNPHSYQIYDARVATAINAIQIHSNIAHGIFFPIPSSQNVTVRMFRRRRYSCADIPTAERMGYRNYLALIAAVAKKAGVHREVAEMVLFAEAEVLARRTLAHDGEQFVTWDDAVGQGG